MNRQVIDLIADYLFAPTQTAAQALANAKALGKIWITGNTVIDALQHTLKIIQQDLNLRQQLESHFHFLDHNKKTILVTGHRRENHGTGIEKICDALIQIVEDPSIQIVFPVHLNPAVYQVVHARLANKPNVYLIEPLDYVRFVYMMQLADIILTDSGGVQEEAPYLQKPVLVMRDVTERPEAVAAGTVKLVGTETKNIINTVRRLLTDAQYYSGFQKAINPYGDGQASQRIVNALLDIPVTEFQP